ncbi:hypothetical protein [Duganella sp. BuS-21]|uniref:hypothetical protein n=1 Tax=Duganella sp. BuS-21 TaxID=2943848 RepID=UPI0035A73EA2
MDKTRIKGVADQGERATHREAVVRYLLNRRCAIQPRVLMNRIYYQERQRIFEFLEGVIKVIAILGGSLAFSNIAAPWLV